MKLVIVDYNLSNLFSVQHAFECLGYTPLVTSNKKDINDADALILPGVGAFAAAMENLHQLDLVEPIKDFVASGKDFMGVCLGMQLLFSESEEFGLTKGFDFIKGSIKKFPVITATNEKLKVPHVCWNKIYGPDNGVNWKKSPLRGIKEGAYMYFVHSFYADSEEGSSVLTKTTYGDIEYCSSVLKNNVFATQFHPEKSGEEGLNIYKNWLECIKEKT